GPPRPAERAPMLGGQSVMALPWWNATTSRPATRAPAAIAIHGVAAPNAVSRPAIPVPPGPPGAAFMIATVSSRPRPPNHTVSYNRPGSKKPAPETAGHRLPVTD